MKESLHFPASALFILAAFLLVFKASLGLDVEGSHVFLPLVPLGDSSLAPTHSGQPSTLEVLCLLQPVPSSPGPVPSQV